MTRIIACFIFFVISICQGFTKEITLRQETGPKAYVIVSKYEGAHILAQTGQSLSYGLNINFMDIFGVGAFVGLGVAQPSAIKDGYLYRGYSSLSADISIFFLLKAPQDNEAAIARPYAGVGVSGGFLYNKYAFLEQYFISTRAGMEPRLYIPLTADQFPAIVSLGAPLQWYFRKDLEVHASFGLSLYLSLRVPVPKEKAL